MARAIIIPADANARLTVADLSTLEDYQGVVGGLIEPVTLCDDTTMFVNEEGKLIGLPENGRASIYAAEATQGDSIRGDVVLVGPVDEHGEHTDLWLVPEPEEA